MNKMRYSLIFLFLFFLMGYHWIEGQDDFQHLEKKVKQYTEWMVKEDSQDIWDAASRLEKLGPNAIPLIQKKMKELPENAQVGCAKALIAMGSKYYGIQVLMTILKDGKDIKAKTNAAVLIGVHGDYELDDQLMKILEGTNDPYLKIAIAKALWNVAQKVEAKKILKEFASIGSGNTDIQFTAAIALAEIGDVETVKPILIEIKNEPSMRGTLARALLEQEIKVKHYEEELLKARAAKAKVPEPKTAIGKQYQVLEEVLSKIQKYHVYGDTFTTDQLITAAIKGMVEETDIHSAFWTKKEWDDFDTRMSKEQYEGIGVYVNLQGGYFTVIAPIYSGPAYKAGIRSMDKIMAVEDWSTVDKKMEEIINRIRGPAGTDVRLKIHRSGWAQYREIVIKREKIKIPNLFYQLLPEGIGYLRLLEFSRKATIEMEAAIGDMQSKGMKALILDLRQNAGGWLQTAVEVIDRFVKAKYLFNMDISFLKSLETRELSPEMIRIFQEHGITLGSKSYIQVHPNAQWTIRDEEKKQDYAIYQEETELNVYEADKLIVYSKGRDPVRGKENRYYTTNRGNEPDYPMILLVDQASASASEIVAGALQCHKRAILVGTRTYGKGSVQEPMSLNSLDGAKLKLTIAMYYLPDGRCIHNEMDRQGNITKHNGIQPDIEVSYEQWEPWKNEEKAKLDEKDAFKQYLDKYYSKNKELFQKLADNDSLSTALYPDFDEWYKSLNTKASPQDVRFWLRSKIRQQVADDRGVEYACDYLEDIMLQRGIIELCKKLNIATENVPQFQIFAKKFEDKKGTEKSDKKETEKSDKKETEKSDKKE